MVYLILKTAYHGGETLAHPAVTLEKAFIFEVEAQEYCKEQNEANNNYTVFSIVEVKSLSISEEISVIYSFDVSRLHATLHPEFSVHGVYDDAFEAEEVKDNLNELSDAWMEYFTVSLELV